MERRNFFKTTMASALGYTLIVKAPQSLANDVKNPTSLATIKSAPNAVGIDFNSIMKNFALECDVCIAGGGLAGVTAALASARKGAKTILIQDRSHLGGNASSEVRMHPLGVNAARLGQREGGIIEELKLENAANNLTLSWDVWDFMLYDKCVSEKNLTLLLDTSLVATKTDGRKIISAMARSDSKMSLYEISAKIFIDCTGDSRLALEAGAEVMSGREGYDAFKEENAKYDDIGTRQGSSIMFVSKIHDKEVPFKAPSWAKKITDADLKFRGIPEHNLGYGYWWIELGGIYDAIRESDKLRFELLSIVMGVWDYIKNSGKYPSAKNRALDFIGMLPGRRDTFRIIGDYIMTGNDIEGGWKKFDDAIAVGGWSMDDHPKEGFYATDKHPCRQDGRVPFYNIPFASIYSKDFDNLMMAGRNISCSHVAFTSTRVMSTCAAVGQAAGTAAALCVEKSTTPRAIRSDIAMMRKLQQILLRDDQTIIGIQNEDAHDLARSAKVTASESIESSKPENVISTVTIDLPNVNNNRWLAPISSKPWLKLEWEKSLQIASVRILFDSWHVNVTQSSLDDYLSTMHRGAEPRLAKDYNLIAILPDGSEKVLVEVKNNIQKLCVHNFEKISIKAVRLDLLSTNGAINVRVKEIRVEA